VGNPEDHLSRLGRAVDAEEDELLLARGPDPRGRARFLAAASSPRGRWRLGAVAAAAIAAGVLLAAWPRRPISFQVGVEGSAEAGAVGAWIAPPDRAVPLRFSDGTRVRIEPGARVRVAALGARGGQIVVEDGAVRVEVRAGARWSIESGPYSVIAEAASFEVRWDLAAEVLRVELAAGSAAVSGPGVGAAVRVAAGEELRVLRREDRVERRPRGQVEAPSTSATAAAIAPPEPASAAPRIAPPPSARPRPPAPPRPSWRELVAAGKYPEALVAAEGEGFPRICAEGSAADLRDLADAARLSGHAARAVEALRTLRGRFAGSEQAAEAAYLLGILAFDGAPAEAARWFGAYLAERPAGRLSREAAGRLIEAAERGGDRAAARAAAQRYLRDHPGGPHAEIARVIADGG
jgi:hypothetical protein